MTGYNVTFETIFEGTLCGRWPDTGVWLCLLAMRDRNGHIDKTPEYIAAITGIPLQTLLDCIERFCHPDPRSRTKTDDGRRLRLIEAGKEWGWAVINHHAYGERARLIAKNRREVESGQNVGRMSDRRRPPPTAADRPEPPPTPSLNSQLSTDNSEEPPKAPQRGRSRSAIVKPTIFEEVVIGDYHRTLPDHPKVKTWTRKRQQLLKTRIADGLKRGKPADGSDYWLKFFEHVAKSDFLCGRGKTDFICSLEWLLLPENFAKVIEGNYHHTNGAGSGR